jgi:hypothetical protein
VLFSPWTTTDWGACACVPSSPYRGTRKRTVSCPKEPCAGSAPSDTELCSCAGTWEWKNVGSCDCESKKQTQELVCPPGAACGAKPSIATRNVFCECPKEYDEPPDGVWHEGMWQKCDCKTKTQTRIVTCPPGHDCGPRPTTLRDCPSDIETRECPKSSTAWIMDLWGSCDCAAKVQYRRVYCPDSSCDPTTKPESVRAGDCATKCAPAPGGTWQPSAWSRCDCSSGTQTQTYECIGGNCPGESPSPMVRSGECPVQCALTGCSPDKLPEPVGDWLMSRWSACKIECDKEPGKQTRTVCKQGTGPQPTLSRTTDKCKEECQTRS